MFRLSLKEIWRGRIHWFSFLAATTLVAFIIYLAVLYSWSTETRIAELLAQYGERPVRRLRGFASSAVWIYGVPSVVMLSMVLKAMSTRLAPAFRLLRFAGVTSRQLCLVMLVQVLAIGAAACLVGGAAAAATSPLVFSLVNVLTLTPGLAPTQFVATSGTFLVIMAGLLILAAARPLVRIARMSPVVSKPHAEIQRPGLGRKIFGALALVALVAALAFPAMIARRDAGLAGLDPGDKLVSGLSQFGYLTMLVVLCCLGAWHRSWHGMLLAGLQRLVRWAGWLVACRNVRARLSMTSAIVLPSTVALGAVFVTWSMNRSVTKVKNAYPNVAAYPDSLGQFFLFMVPLLIVVVICSLAILVISDGELRRGISVLRSAGVSRSGLLLSGTSEAMVLTVLIAATTVAIVVLSTVSGLVYTAVAGLGVHWVQFGWGELFVAFAGLFLLFGCFYLVMVLASLRRPLPEELRSVAS